MPPTITELPPRTSAAEGPPLDELAQLLDAYFGAKVGAENKTLMIRGDVRTTLSRLPDESVDCVITSPPYGDQKDYGSRDEIGNSRSTYREFLEDLRAVFSHLHRCAKPGAAMWVVLDTIKRDGRSRPLPWDAIHEAELVGWTFQDIVVWDKGKNLPWSHSGHFRGVCEFVLLLSKGPLTRFEINEVRDSTHLSSYWVKYPERYHPLGKAPSDLWHFPIPVQGSWGQSALRHFCPFPPELVERMIRITTKPGDIVLDPFAGTGTAVAVAGHLGRRGIGIEINESYVDAYAQGGHEAILRTMQSGIQGDLSDKEPLSTLIGKLRVLKTPRALFTGLSRPDRFGARARDLIAAIILETPQKFDGRNFETASVKLIVLVHDPALVDVVERTASLLLSVPPLSKFGVTASVRVLPLDDWKRITAACSIEKRDWFLYENGVFNFYKTQLQPLAGEAMLQQLNLSRGRKYPPILANLGVRIQTGLPD